jgi:hypothetical protein
MPITKPFIAYSIVCGSMILAFTYFGILLLTSFDDHSNLTPGILNGSKTCILFL